jgi:hypothetical protein
MSGMSGMSGATLLAALFVASLIAGLALAATVPAHAPVTAGFLLAGLDTATPYLKTFAGADAGKTAHYRLRWVNTRQEAGPWSPVYSATITA